MLSFKKSEVRSQKTAVVSLICLLSSEFCLLTSSAQSQTVSLSAVGDVLLDRGVAKQIRAHGTDYPFQFVAPTIGESLRDERVNFVVVNNCGSDSNQRFVR